MKQIVMACSLAMVLSTLLYAQTPLGQITGIVLNEDGQPVVHAAACISTEGSTKTECSVLTDEGAVRDPAPGHGHLLRLRY
jgi:hypothetical protein